MKAYRIQRVSPRKTNVEVYSVYPDCGPYCVAWVPVKRSDLPRLESELAAKGIVPLDSLPNGRSA